VENQWSRWTYLTQAFKLYPEVPKKSERTRILFLYVNIYSIIMAGKVCKCRRWNFRMRDKTHQIQAPSRLWTCLTAEPNDTTWCASICNTARTMNIMWHYVTTYRNASTPLQTFPAIKIKYIPTLKNKIRVLSDFFGTSGYNLKAWVRYVHLDHWFSTPADLSHVIVIIESLGKKWKTCEITIQ
jgi:hypothetical protein